MRSRRSEPPLIRTIPARPEHVAERPSWDCRVCGQPWPCAVAKVDLAEQFARRPTALTLYLSANLYEAIEDMRVATRGSPAGLSGRFLDWAGPLVRAHERLLPARTARPPNVPSAAPTATRQQIHLLTRGAVVINSVSANAPASAPSTPPSLAGIDEILDLLVKISRERVLRLSFRSDFPEPVAELAEGDVWHRDEVEAWINEHGDVVADMLRQTQ